MDLLNRYDILTKKSVTRLKNIGCLKSVVKDIKTKEVDNNLLHISTEKFDTIIKMNKVPYSTNISYNIFNNGANNLNNDIYEYVRKVSIETVDNLLNIVDTLDKKNYDTYIVNSVDYYKKIVNLTNSTRRTFTSKVKYKKNDKSLLPFIYLVYDNKNNIKVSNRSLERIVEDLGVESWNNYKTTKELLDNVIRELNSMLKVKLTKHSLEPVYELLQKTIKKELYIATEPLPDTTSTGIKHSWHIKFFKERGVYDKLILENREVKTGDEFTVDGIMNIELRELADRCNSYLTKEKEHSLNLYKVETDSLRNRIVNLLEFIISLNSVLLKDPMRHDELFILRDITLFITRSIIPIYLLLTEKVYYSYIFKIENVLRLILELCKKIPLMDAIRKPGKILEEKDNEKEEENQEESGNDDGTSEAGTEGNEGGDAPTSSEGVETGSNEVDETTGESESTSDNSNDDGDDESESNSESNNNK